MIKIVLLMLHRMNWPTKGSVILLALLIVLTAFVTVKYLDIEKPFKTVNRKGNRALFPVLQLISAIKNNNWNLIPQSFSSPDINPVALRNFEVNTSAWPRPRHRVKLLEISRPSIQTL